MECFYCSVTVFFFFKKQIILDLFKKLYFASYSICFDSLKINYFNGLSDLHCEAVNIFYKYLKTV